MRLLMLGVRGSTPAPGPEFVRYGGHTSCVAVYHDGEDQPSLVLDAGTGLRDLTKVLGGAPYRGSIVVSHLHWDHVQGLPFFVAGDRPDAEVAFYVPAQNARTGRDLLAAAMAPPNFPITPEGLQGAWSFHALEAGYHQIAGFRVRATEVRHKGGRTFGYRISDESGSIAYLPDHITSVGVSNEVKDLVHDVDVLLHDAQFVEKERALSDAYGHSTVDDAIALAQECGARRLVCVHHGPARTDDALDAIAELHADDASVCFAKQGDIVVVGR
ncbi:MAG: MBL fold metallo-hydrolase, partial [Candidatus Nanopelagicales bacterium]